MKKKVTSAISLVILILILLYVSGIIAQFMINIKKVSFHLNYT